MKDNINSYQRAFSVLYIEDDFELQKHLKPFLESFFTDISVSISSEDALKKYFEYFELNNKYYDFVITDVELPGENGIQLSKKILQINPDQDIIVVTAYSDSEKLQNILDLGIKTYIKKPFNYKNFLEKMTKVIDKHIAKLEVAENLYAIEQLNQELDAMVDSFDKYVIASRTDKKGIITYASRAYETISGYTKQELLGQPHCIVRHYEMPKNVFKELWETIKAQKVWVGEIKNLKKDGSFYWVKATIGPYYDKNGKHIGYSAIREDITAKKEVEELHQQVNDLLNNAGQGFLSFDSDFMVLNGYSKECINIFGKEIYGENIAELLFYNDEEKKGLFCYGINNLVDEELTLSIELTLSLFPKEISIQGKALALEFKYLKKHTYMLIITDITEKKQLEEKVKQQQQTKKMIVAVVEDKKEFIDLKNKFIFFIDSLTNILDSDKSTSSIQQYLKNEFHTYKGLFLQKECSATVEVLHHLEGIVLNFFKKSSNIKDLVQIIYDINPLERLEQDLKKVKKVLGENCFDIQATYEVDTDVIDRLENGILGVSKFINKDKDNILDDILLNTYLLKEKTLYERLNSFSREIELLSSRLNKPMKPFKIEGDRSLIVLKELKPFTNSLIHLFRNAMVHGIEDVDIRQQNNKELEGEITCKFYQKNSKLILEFKDDGRGIDLGLIKDKALELALYSKKELENMSEKDLLKLLFRNDFSTAYDLTDFAGRGNGLNAIDYEIKALNGVIKIENSLGKGVKFIFTIPIYDELKTYLYSKYILGQIIKQLEKFFTQNSKVKIQNTEYINSISLLKYNISIKLKGDIDALVVFSLDQNIFEILSSFFIPHGFSSDEKQQMLQELPKEIGNIFLGLCLQELPNNGENFTIGIPKIIGSDKLKKKIQKGKNTISSIIQTDQGVLNFSLINQ